MAVVDNVEQAMMALTQSECLFSFTRIIVTRHVFILIIVRHKTSQ
jgi:hypothetical protein